MYRVMEKFFEANHVPFHKQYLFEFICGQPPAYVPTWVPAMDLPIWAFMVEFDITTVNSFLAQRAEFWGDSLIDKLHKLPHAIKAMVKSFVGPKLTMIEYVQCRNNRSLISIEQGRYIIWDTVRR